MIGYVRLDGYNAAQHPIALPEPGTDSSSAYEDMYEDREGRDPSPPGASFVQRAARRLALPTVGRRKGALPPPGVERPALNNLADAWQGVMPYREGHVNTHATMQVGAEFPQGIQRPQAPRRGNTWRARPANPGTAVYVNVVPQAAT